MKSETVRIHFLSDVLICCHPEILLPWQRDVTTSPLYWVSVLSGLILEKIYMLLFGRDKRNSPLYPGVGIKWVSVERDSTVPDTNFVVLCSYMNIMQYSKSLV